MYNVKVEGVKKCLWLFKNDSKPKQAKLIVMGEFIKNEKNVKMVMFNGL